MNLDIRELEVLVKETSIKLNLDPDLPEPITCKIRDIKLNLAKRCRTVDAIQLSTESTIRVYGLIRQVLQGKAAPGNVELQADYWELIGKGPAGGVEEVCNAKSEVDVLLDNRHLTIRWERYSKIFRAVSIICGECHGYFRDQGYIELPLQNMACTRISPHCTLYRASFVCVSYTTSSIHLVPFSAQVHPPTLVQTPMEDLSEVFTFPYFGETACLSQSAQLYLESCVPAFGDCYSVTHCYRSEKSRTRRHLAEFIQFEAEFAFIDLSELINKIESMIVDISKRVMDKAGDLIHEINPKFVPPQKPFKRVRYDEALDILNQWGITKDDLTPFSFGDPITEGVERRLVDRIGEPVLLTHFPVTFKVFYMQHSVEDPRVTDSVDLLIPGVGEVVGGSMRMTDAEGLLKGYKEQGLDPSVCYWYTDLVRDVVICPTRRFGTFPHGGYRLGFERYCMWVLGQDHIRNVTLYPRFTSRCLP
ncbi:unnamed protein product [Echinostoma caproni]|uniref:asparagine--tRNA ligase n=1 Tax=Echinostoma caproni TaxID=27848 RepID=A0A183ATY7_9TREM|nr:unnamed protein product [Echinostoma caproni]